MSTMKKLIESVDECMATEGPMGAPSMPPMGAPEDKGNPVTVNVSMNASGKEHVADLLDMMKNAGLGGAEEVSGATLSPRMDMEKFRDIIDTDGDNMPSPEEDVDEITKAQEKLPPQLQKAIKDKEEKEGDVDEWANSAPGEEASDRGDMGDYEDNIRDGDDLHAKKPRKAIRTVNPALENIKETLYKALSEKKISEGEVPAGLKAYQAKKGKGKAPAKGKSKSGKMPMDAGKDGKKGTKDDKPAFLTKEGYGGMVSKQTKDRVAKDVAANSAALAKKGKNPDGSLKKKDKKVADITKESLEEAKLIVEMGCVGEMKKLNASGCSKNEMYKKINAEYNCGKEKFEKLYASHCG